MVLAVSKFRQVFLGNGVTVTPPPTATVQWGSSSSQPSSDYWNREMQGASNPNGLYATCGMIYGSGGVAPRWNDVAVNFPSTHDIWLQTKDTTRAQYDATLASFPATRTGKVYVYYFNEPEDNMSAATYISRVTDLFNAIDAANKPYVVRAQQLNGYKLLPAASWDEVPYAHPRTEHVGWSTFAGKKLLNGHIVSTYDPDVYVQKIQALHQTAWGGTDNVPWAANAWGMAIPDANFADAQSQANRLQWAKDSSAAFIAANVTHLMWYDIYQSATVGDYRVHTSPTLLAWWRSPAAAAGA